MGRVRIDKRLVDLGIVESRSRAAELIEMGLVLVNGSIADKVARLVDLGDQIMVNDEGHRYVSRGAYKIIGGLDAFNISVKGRWCIDAGSSTGGFTEVLLERGARGVLCIDVGTHQLHERLRQDPRVCVHEETNVRDVSRALATDWLNPEEAIDLVVGDLSFTSLEPHMETILALAGDFGEVLILAKPQFEVGRDIAAKGRGVIRRREDQFAGLLRACGAVSKCGGAIKGLVASPLRGASGNREFLLWAHPSAPQVGNVVEMIDRALDSVGDSGS